MRFASRVDSPLPGLCAACGSAEQSTFRAWRLRRHAVMRAVSRSLLLFLGMAGSVQAQNAGSRIGTTPEVPLAPRPVASELTKRCDALRGEERSRCLREAQNDAPSGTPPKGPASTGMGSGAGTGTGANSGTGGGASFGNGAAR